MIELAELLYRANRLDEARSYAHLIEVDHGNLRLLKLLTVLATGRDKLDQQELYLCILTAANPSVLDYRKALFGILVRKHEFRRASYEGEFIVKYEPKEAKKHAALAEVYRMLGKLGEAEFLSLDAVYLAPTNYTFEASPP